MLIYRKNPEAILKNQGDPPKVAKPYHKDESGISKPFHESDDMENLIRGYSPGPEISYAHKLIEKYPLLQQ